jgi:hypothetical protein
MCLYVCVCWESAADSGYSCKLKTYRWNALSTLLEEHKDWFKILGLSIAFLRTTQAYVSAAQHYGFFALLPVSRWSCRLFSCDILLSAASLLEYCKKIDIYLGTLQCESQKWNKKLGLAKTWTWKSLWSLQVLGLDFCQVHVVGSPLFTLHFLLV